MLSIDTENHIEGCPTPPNSPTQSRLERMRKILNAELKEKERKQKQRWIEISTRNKQYQIPNEFMRIRKNQNSKKSQYKRKTKRMLKPIEEQRMNQWTMKKYYGTFIKNYFTKMTDDQRKELETIDMGQRRIKKICVGCCEPVYFGKDHKNDCAFDYPVEFLFGNNELPDWILVPESC